MPVVPIADDFGSVNGVVNIFLILRIVTYWK